MFLNMIDWVLGVILGYKTQKTQKACNLGSSTGCVVIWDCAHTKTRGDDTFRDLSNDKTRDDVGDGIKEWSCLGVFREAGGIFKHWDVVDDCEVDFVGDICVTDDNDESDGGWSIPSIVCLFSNGSHKKLSPKFTQCTFFNFKYFCIF